MKGATKGTTRKPKAVDQQLRQVLAENVRRLMEARYPGLRNQARKLAHDTGLALSTLQRLLAADVGATVDTLGAIARLFRLPPYKLLIRAEEASYFIDAREIVERQRDGVHTSVRTNVMRRRS